MRRCLNNLRFEPFNYNLLIIEDSSLMIKIIDNIFSNYGFNTFLSFTLKNAREVINSNKIDYILDINLPDGNGYELIKELFSSQPKVIVITSQINLQLKDILINRNYNILVAKCYRSIGNNLFKSNRFNVVRFRN